jgi:hypothetical protein
MSDTKRAVRDMYANHARLLRAAADYYSRKGRAEVALAYFIEADQAAAIAAGIC